jgi:hypothetical protein
MKDLWLWMYENDATSFSVSHEYVQMGGGKYQKMYQVFTVPTQRFTVKHLSEITVERLDKEKARAHFDVLETSRALKAQFEEWAKEGR